MGERKCLSAVLMTDYTNEENSRESSNAIVALTRAKVPFLTESSEEHRGPVLVDDDRIFRGLEGVRRYIDECKAREMKKAE